MSLKYICVRLVRQEPPHRYELIVQVLDVYPRHIRENPYCCVACVSDIALRKVQDICDALAVTTTCSVTTSLKVPASIEAYGFIKQVMGGCDDSAKYDNAAHEVAADGTQGMLYLLEMPYGNRSSAKHEVLKFGRTKKLAQRLQQYPRGARVLFCCAVNDMTAGERHVQTFVDTSPHFMKRPDIGDEYCEGDPHTIIQLMARYMAHPGVSRPTPNSHALTAPPEEIWKWLQPAGDMLTNGASPHPGDFVIDLDKVAKWLKTIKGNLKQTLLKSYTQGVDYEVTKPFVGAAGRGKAKTERIMMTTDAFKSLCMQSRTPKAAEVRAYFLTCERTLFRYRDEITAQSARRGEQAGEGGRHLCDPGVGGDG